MILATKPAARIAVGLVSSAVAATMLVPSAAGAAPLGGAAAHRVVSAPVANEHPDAATPRFLLITTAPIGMAGPAAPAPRILVADRPTGNPKDGPINEQAWAARSGAELAGAQAAEGALWGGIAGAVVGGLAGAVVGIALGAVAAPLLLVVIAVGAVAGAAIGAAIGAGIGAAIGGVAGYRIGYDGGLGDARWHNGRVRQYSGRTAGAGPRATRTAGVAPRIDPCVAPRLAEAVRRVGEDANRASADLHRRGARLASALNPYLPRLP